jgi:hypothetical protein
LILSDVLDTELLQTLAERFIAASGAALDMDGSTVINMYRRRVALGQKVVVRVHPAMSRPVQGLRIKLSDGTIHINGQVLKEVVVWFDTSPLEFEFSCHPKKDSTSELRIWNCWRDTGGASQAWVGNAGIIVEESERGTVLHCSTGTGKFDPGQLEVELKL